MAKKPTSKSTKAEILEAYEELMQEKKELESQVAQLPQDKPQEKIPEKPPQVKASDVELKRNNTKVNQDKMEQIIDGLDRLQLGFGGAVSELSEKLTTEATKLADVQSTVAAETEELKALHDLEIAEDTLDTLIQQYEDSSKAFEEEFNDRRESLEQETQDLKNAWSKEQAEHERLVRERLDDLQKTRQRDADSYQYDLEQQRNLSIDEYEHQQQLLDQELAESRQLQEKLWADREKAIADREKEFAECKTKVEEFPQKLEENTERGKDNGRNIGRYQAKVKADLREKEVEGQKHFYELRLQSLSQTINNQEARIQSLSQQLDSALKQVQDLAVKAIEGASNAKSSEAIKEIAMEQAKQLKGK
ncbi:MAG: hypothetical protein EBE86_015580 [Hormoscilla sp. GUM202]|nr:hypothetical protein [Hormoscilla sp. GUM202]